MVKNEEQKAKFKTFNIDPKTINIPVDGTTATVRVYGTIESSNEKKIVDITLTHPHGKIETNPVFYAKTGTNGIFNFEWKYGASKGTETGEYKVKATLQENPAEVKSGEFRVNPPNSK